MVGQQVVLSRKLEQLCNRHLFYFMKTETCMKVRRTSPGPAPPPPCSLNSHESENISSTCLTWMGRSEELASRRSLEMVSVSRGVFAEQKAKFVF